MKFRTLTGLAAMTAAAALLAACASSNNGEMGVMGDDKACCSEGAEACCKDGQAKDGGNMGVVGTEKGDCSAAKSCGDKSSCTDKPAEGNMGVVGDEAKKDGCSSGGGVCPVTGKQG